MIKRLKAKLNHDRNLQEILTGSAVTFALKMSGMLLGYLVVLIVSRQYGAEGIGVYNLTLSIMTFVSMIAVMGINVSILRYVGQFNKSGKEYKLKLLYRYAIELVVPFSLLLAVGLYFFSGAIADKVFHNPVYKPALEFAAIIVPFMSLQNISVEFIRGLKQLEVSEFLRNVSRPFINIVLLSILGWVLVNELLPLYTLGVGIVASAIFAVHFIVKRIVKIELKSRDEFSKNELVTTSFPMLIGVLSAFIIGNVTLFFLQVFSTTTQVGIFSVSQKIALLISLVLVVINTIAAPKFSELYWAKEYKSLQKIIYQTTKIIFFVSLFIAVIVAAFNKQILGLFGDEFLVGSTALLLLVVGQIGNAATGSVGMLLNMTGNQKVLRNIIFVTMISSIVLSYIFIPVFGINGAAFVSMFATISVNVISAFYVKKKLGYTTYYLPKIFKDGK